MGNISSVILREHSAGDELKMSSNEIGCQHYKSLFDDSFLNAPLT